MHSVAAGAPLEPVPPRIDEYRILRALEREGEGCVLAHDEVLDRAVVLRLLSRTRGAAGIAARLSVARALARVSHPHLFRVHRVQDAGPHPYVVFSFARGKSLDAMPTPWPDAPLLELGECLAGALSAIHAVGVVHREVHARHVFLSDDEAAVLSGFDALDLDSDAGTRRRDVRALFALVASFAGVTLRARLSRLLDEAGDDLSAEELRASFAQLAHPGAALVADDENPYRGLRPFEAHHASVFFGRQEAVADLVERLRGQPILLVAGRSGAGKSSLVRAGLVPVFAAGARVLGERAAWDVVTLVPGSRPLRALAEALAPVLDRRGDELAEALRADAAFAARLARARKDRGLLLVVDQLEEALTLADSAERDAFAQTLSRWNALAPGVRLVLTMRSDFLPRLAELGPLGRDLLRATYVLPPMTRGGLRDAIAAPARARGFELENAAMVDGLIDEVSGRAEALPLLSFALAELWGARDTARKVLPETELRRLGGAAGALARQGDLVLASMKPEERVETRRMLLSLVTEGKAAKCARRTEAELVGPAGLAGEAAKRALDALVRGRLVVVGETCEIAHEALVDAWPRLRGWLDEASDARATAARLAVAVRDWVSAGRVADGLWGSQQLTELEAVGAAALEQAGNDGRAFVVASLGAVKRARLRRLTLRVGIPLVLLLAGAATWGTVVRRHRAAVAAVVAEASALHAKAEETAREAADLRARAFALFDKDDVGPAEKLWKKTLAREIDADDQRRAVGAIVDRALALEPTDAAARSLYADVTLARILAAERLREGALLAGLRGRLGLYDDGSRAASLVRRGHVRITTEPADARAAVTLSRYRDPGNGHLIEADTAPLTTGATELEAGSYLAVATLPGRFTTRYPFTVDPGEERDLRIVLPRTEDVRESMVYVPAGRFLYGSGDDEATRGLLTHQPIRAVELPAFLIARTETTWGDYLAFLRALPEEERKERQPKALMFDRSGLATLALPGAKLAEGQAYCLPPHPCVPWQKLPVKAVSRDDGEAYAAWLARSWRVPGARMCTDREWERAARGADDRQYVWGDAEPGADDACSLEAYAGETVRAGPCEPGTHPFSRSPFGVDDLVGSVWEWTAGMPDTAQPAIASIRGGAYTDFGVCLAIANRALTAHKARFSVYGLRVCADAR